MLFNSLDFAIFLPIVFFLYWFLFKKNLTIQNIFILLSSYIFYGWWDWRFLSLIIVSSLADYFIGLGLSNQENAGKRKFLLFCSIIVNLGLLGYYKYYGFFATNFYEAFRLFGKQLNINTLNIILPVGISFYTFQTMSYSIDVYRKKMKPTKNLISFLAFVSFFPQLVAGPIERASNLLPQFNKKRIFEYNKARDGLRQIIWGLFKKVVIADGCAVYVNEIFYNYPHYSGSTLFIGVFLFAFQIYCDFSGYSDIAIGTARLLGFNLMRNFAFPYFSRDIAEFWRRWHISLSTWFRDYVYIPLGGSKVTSIKKIRNTLIIFVVSGFWHGANWTFIFWGFLNALYFLPLLIFGKNRKYLNIVAQKSTLPTIKEIYHIISTFLLTNLAWIFFRAKSVNDAFSYVAKIFSKSLFFKPEIFPIQHIILIILLISIEWIQREKQHALEFDSIKIPKLFRWSIYYVVVIMIFWFENKPQEFIYFQF